MTGSRPSSTALLIARVVLVADKTPTLRPMLLGETAELTRRLLNAAEPAAWFKFVWGYRWARSLIFLAERLSLPGIILHYLARKRHLDALAQEAIAAGCRQLVVLGAGFDTVAMRMYRSHPQLSCFEIDHPATQSTKRRACGDGLILISADLSDESPAKALSAEARFDRNAPTLFVAEGLLMYLPEARVEALLRELAELSAPGSRFAFTFMEARPGRTLAFYNGTRVIDWWLRWRGEAFRWGVARAAVGDFIAQFGWRLASISSPEELRRRFLAPHDLEHAPLAIGESIALAMRADAAPEARNAL